MTTIVRAALVSAVLALVVIPPAEAADVGFFTIRNKLEAMTDVQKEAYIKSLKGQKVVWTGWVEDVSQDWGGGYSLRIDMDNPKSGITVADTRFPVSQAMASKFRKGQRVTFSGRINTIMEMLGHYEVDLGSTQILKM